MDGIITYFYLQTKYISLYIHAKNIKQHLNKLMIAPVKKINKMWGMMAGSTNRSFVTFDVLYTTCPELKLY